MKPCPPRQISDIAAANSLGRTTPWTGYRALLTVALFMIMMLPTAPAGESDTAVEGNNLPSVDLGPFQRFLADPPWIKYVRFRRSGNQLGTLIYPEQGKRFVIPCAWAYYDGALQPNGFFLRHLAHTGLYYKAKEAGGGRILDELVYDPPKPGEEWMIGASARHWWQLDDRYGMFIIAPRESEPGHSVSNGVEIIANMEIKHLKILQCLGMPELVDAEVEWLHTTRFQATSWQHGRIEGTITRWLNELVEELEYQVARPVKQRVFMRYAYSPQQRMPPIEMVRTVTDDSGTRSFTNIIDQWEEGLDLLRPQGFTVGDFRKKTEPFTSFLVWSNGLRYKLDQQGVLTRTIDTPPDYSEIFPTSRFRTIYQAVLLAGGLVLLGVLVGIWRTRKKHSTTVNRML